MIRYLLNFFLFVLPPSRLFGLRRACLRGMRVVIADDANVCACWIYGRGALQIGQGSWVSPNTIFYTHPNAPIAIGDRCDIGPSVRVLTGSHEIGLTTRRAGRGTALPVIIGNGCWIGASTTILGGVTIGEGAIIAAGSLVARNIPANVLAAGVPAVIKRPLP